jgi:hypothetical protein
VYVSFLSLLRKAIGDFRYNKAAAFVHGTRVLTTTIGGAIAGLSILAYFDIIRPVQVLQAAGYAALLFIMDYAFINDLAFGLRFIAPDFLGFLSLSTIVSGVTAVGALSIAWRWHRSRR